MNCSLISLKKYLGWNTFGPNNEIIAQMNAYIDERDKSYYLEGAKELEERWTKFMGLKEVEK